MKVVLDTNVLVSTTLWEGSAYKTLGCLLDRNAKIYTSRAILDEYEEIILRDFPSRSSQLPLCLGRIMEFSTIVKPSAKLNVVKNDPDDDRILECAVAAGAEFILTYDRHLLKLSVYDGIAILTPERMRALMQESKK